MDSAVPRGKTLTHSDYIVRKVGTNFAQCVHRIRLRPVSPHTPPADLTVVDPSNFIPDPSRRTTGMEPEVFDEHFPALFIEDPVSSPPRPAPPPPTTVSLSFRAPPAGAPVTLPPNPVDPPFEAHGSSTSSSPSSSPQLSSDENASSSSGEAPPPSPLTLRPRPTTGSVPESSSQRHATTGPKVTFNPVKKVRTFSTVPYSEREASLAAGAKLPSAPSPHIPNSQLPASAKRTAIKQSILRNRTSCTPSRATQLDQVRASFQKNATGQSSTASSKSTLDPDSSLNSLVTPETNHVTLVDAFISDLLPLSFVVLLEITFFIIRITTRFPGLINFRIRPCNTINLFRSVQ